LETEPPRRPAEGYRKTGGAVKDILPESTKSSNFRTMR